MRNAVSLSSTLPRHALVAASQSVFSGFPDVADGTGDDLSPAPANHELHLGDLSRIKS